MNDVDLEDLSEHLYQLSLGKRPTYNLDAIADVAGKLWPLNADAITDAAAIALALSELRQDLATAEDNRHAHAATGLKRKIDLLEDLMLQCLEQLRV